MNKINFVLALTLTLMAAIACDKDKVSYDMTEAARAAMDRLVGEYELVGAEWDGGTCGPEWRRSGFCFDF